MRANIQMLKAVPLWAVSPSVLVGGVLTAHKPIHPYPLAGILFLMPADTLKQHAGNSNSSLTFFLKQSDTNSKYSPTGFLKQSDAKSTLERGTVYFVNRGVC